jgi:hypothetical protein
MTAHWRSPGRSTLTDVHQHESPKDLAKDKRRPLIVIIFAPMALPSLVMNRFSWPTDKVHGIMETVIVKRCERQPLHRSAILIETHRRQQERRKITIP